MSLEALTGHGTVPPMRSLLSAAAKQLGEIPAEAMFGAAGMGSQLEFSQQGLTPAQLEDFFDQVTCGLADSPPLSL